MSNNSFDVKRILWLEDGIANSEVTKMFPDRETLKAGDMDSALKAINKKEELDSLDTIVLDIDMKDGVKDIGKLIDVLRGKPLSPEAAGMEYERMLYISKEEEEKAKDFLQDNGGYLVYLYLLKKGFPSERIAFLTANSGDLGALNAMFGADGATYVLDPKELSELFEQAFYDTFSDDQEVDPDSKEFLEKCEKTGIPSDFIQSDAFIDAVEQLAASDNSGLMSIFEDFFKGERAINNTLTEKFLKFRSANLEICSSFAKTERDCGKVGGITAMREWMRRDIEEKKIRWLVLNLCKIMLDCLSKNRNMKSFDCEFNKEANHNTFTRDSAIAVFQQLSLHFQKHLGTDEDQKKWSYLQALRIYTTPFDSGKYLYITQSCNIVAKQLRNYCAHNCFGDSMSAQDFFFFLLFITKAYTPLAKTDFKSKNALYEWLEVAEQEFLDLYGIPGELSEEEKKEFWVSLNRYAVLTHNKFFKDVNSPLHNWACRKNNQKPYNSNERMDRKGYSAADFLYNLGYSKEQERSDYNFYVFSVYAFAAVTYFQSNNNNDNALLRFAAKRAYELLGSI